MNRAAASLPELPVQYADFARTQRAWLAGGEAASQLEYWKRQLSGASPLLRLPMDRPASARSGRGARHEVQLGGSLRSGLERLCREAQVTPFMALLAGFQALLFRVSGQDDLTVGSPVAGRNRPELEGLIGFFVNTLALRARFAPQLTFRALLAQLRETALGAFAHQDVPFDQVVEALAPARDLNHAPLFQVLFTLQHESEARLDLPGLRLEALELEPPASKLDLALAISETAEGYRAAFSYDPGLFDAATIERLGDQLRRVLDGAIAAPDTRIVELPLLAADERRLVLEAWNRTAVEVPSDVTLHGLFLEQAARTPEAVALTFEGGKLTYGQLAEATGELAEQLRAAGVGAETRVGVALERSPRMVTALLAVLEAGGAYVPLEPNLPKERLAFLCHDAAVQLVLSERRFEELLPIGTPVRWLDEDRAAGRSPDSLETRARAARSGRPDRLAYVLYTSGSTGHPKGVMVSHRNIANRMLWVQRTYPLGATDAVLLRAPLAFDVSVSELFWPLSAGARLVLSRPGTEADPASLASLVATEQVTVLHFVPTMLQAFLETPGASEAGRSLRHVLCGGEALSQELAERFARTFAAKLHQLYGPTEASIDATAHSVTTTTAPIPIGTPTANAKTYVLDAALQPVPPGVLGELHLAGTGVTRGYFGRPDLTAERFLPDPFGAPGTRMYRAGDLARWRPDGMLVFAGRVDDQVKIRGVRVELGEIEAVLSGHPAVEACAVVLRHDGPGGPRLVAYVEAKPGSVTVADLGARARSLLPQAVVPSAYVVLDALPLSQNGKIDRWALPAPEPLASRTILAPRDALERDVATVFEDVLEQHPVGVEDDFFALGGHSLLAVKLAAGLQSKLGRTVPLELIFRAPTVGALADWLRTGVGETACVVLQPEGAKTPLILVHPISGHLGGYRDLVEALGTERPIHGLQATGIPPFETIEELSKHYVDALRQNVPNGPYVLGGWSVGGVIAFEVARRLIAAGQRVETVLLFDSFAPQEMELPEVSDEALRRELGEGRRPVGARRGRVDRPGANVDPGSGEAPAGTVGCRCGPLPRT